MKRIHQCSTQHRAHSKISVVLIGAGGNGSSVLFGLPYLHQALLAWGPTSGLDVTVIDHDTVSPTNCVRQPFGSADVGLNKATVLVDRVNLFHGLSWEAVSRPFDPKYMPLNTDYMSTVDLVISCVDTKAARAQMHEAFFSHAGAWSNVRYWLDLGNSASSGQFVLGQPLNRANKRAADRLRCVSELFPSIIDVGSGEDAQPSCSAAEALDRQEPFINNVLASSALAMLTRLLRYGQISHLGALFNAESGRSAPLPIDPEAWTKHRRRQTRGAKAG
jgi:PRTRC genetic system ThiF family protein